MVDMDPSSGLAALFWGGVNKTLCNKALRKPAKHLANPLVVVPAAGPRHTGCCLSPIAPTAGHFY